MKRFRLSRTYFRLLIVATALFLTAILIASPALSVTRNVIFFIGDGMGLAQVTAARYQSLGPEGRLEMEALPYTGIVKTHSADRLITDSAASGTAMATGHKTNNGMIAVLPDGSPVGTVLESALAAGRSAGVVSTTTITNATPAVFVAHHPKRNEEDRIAEQMVRSKATVMMGGGLQFFIPSGTEGSKRKDSRDLLAEARERGFAVVRTESELDRVSSGRVLGLFELSGMMTGKSSVTLAEMTAKAIDIMNDNPNGFFLMVEGGQIDWAGHDNNFEDMLREFEDFEAAIGIAREMTDPDETLILITADHETGGLSIIGGRLEKGSLKVAWSSGGHTAISVPLFAGGPGAESFTGVIDNTVIPGRIARAMGIEFPPPAR